MIGVAHPKWQERPVVIVVAEPGQELTDDDVLTSLEGKFAKWQMPDTIIHADALPRTSVGKLDKKVLRTEHGELYQRGEQ